MSDEKSFQYAKRMFPLFRAIVKFCSTNRLLTLIDKPSNWTNVALTGHLQDQFRIRFASYFCAGEGVMVIFDLANITAFDGISH